MNIYVSVMKRGEHLLKRGEHLLHEKRDIGGLAHGQWFVSTWISKFQILSMIVGALPVLLSPALCLDSAEYI